MRDLFQKAEFAFLFVIVAGGLLWSVYGWIAQAVTLSAEYRKLQTETKKAGQRNYPPPR